jgi:hypothetical protein
MTFLVVCALGRCSLLGRLTLLAGGAKQTLLQQGQLLLESGELQLQPRLGVLALELGILLHQLLQSLVQARVLRFQQRGHLLRCFQVFQLLNAHHTSAVVLRGGLQGKLFLFKRRR